VFEAGYFIGVKGKRNVLINPGNRLENAGRYWRRHLCGVARPGVDRAGRANDRGVREGSMTPDQRRSFSRSGACGVPTDAIPKPTIQPRFGWEAPPASRVVEQLSLTSPSGL